VNHTNMPRHLTGGRKKCTSLHIQAEYPRPVPNIADRLVLSSRGLPASSPQSRHLPIVLHELLIPGEDVIRGRTGRHRDRVTPPHVGVIWSVHHAG
jgi:hypothetical protein